MGSGQKFWKHEKSPNRRNCLIGEITQCKIAHLPNRAIREITHQYTRWPHFFVKETWLPPYVFDSSHNFKVNGGQWWSSEVVGGLMVVKWGNQESMGVIWAQHSPLGDEQGLFGVHRHCLRSKGVNGVIQGKQMLLGVNRGHLGSKGVHRSCLGSTWVSNPDADPDSTNPPKHVSPFLTLQGMFPAHFNQKGSYC